MTYATRKRIATIGLATVLVLFWGALTAGMYRSGMTTDFLSFYIGFKLAGQGDYAHLYDPRTQTELQAA